MTERTASGSAEVQGEMWGERAGDWADVMEGEHGWGIPLYELVLERVGLAPGSDVLDVGCGAGRFARLAADRGHSVAGLDAAAGMVEIARQRIPDGDFRVGEMEALPWEDDSFDLVTGFNSFFLAADMVNAMREAGRVARPGGYVATTIFGRPERCDSTPMFEAVRALMPAGTGGGENDGPGLHEEGVLEEVAERAGLDVEEADYIPVEETYPDLETLLRGYTAAGPIARAARVVGEAAVREAIADAFAERRQPDGSYIIREEERHLIARAPVAEAAARE